MFIEPIAKVIEPRTTEEIEWLKATLRKYSCWDIETTEGFARHSDELLAYRKECEQCWKLEKETLLMKFAKPLGLENNLALAEFLMCQEETIAELRAEIQRSNS